jgi:hypothetical protein
VQAAAFVAEHAPHAPLGWHAAPALEPAQSASRAQARQVLVPLSHTGFAPPHWAFVVHERQVPVVASQPGVGPVHFDVLVAEQTPHAPDGSHAGSAPPQSASAVHARHACVAVSQAGLVPPHWALVVQPTHTPAGTSHTDVVPAQRRAFEAEHWPHAPPGWQAGVAPPQSASDAHARQVRVVRSQTGVPPAQSASPAHATHVPVDASQAGVAPAQALLLTAEQAPQEPFG